MAKRLSAYQKQEATANDIKTAVVNLLPHAKADGRNPWGRSP